MKKKPTTTYKARYVIDIELTDEPTPMPMTDEFADREIKVTLESTWRGELSERDGARLDYVEKNFPDAAGELYVRMFVFEAFALIFNSNEIKQKFRKEVILESGKIEQERIRRQLPVSRGPIPKKDSADIWIEREAFIKTSRPIFLELQKLGQYNKTNLAQRHWPDLDYNDALKKLRNTLSDYKMSYDDLLREMAGGN